MSVVPKVCFAAEPDLVPEDSPEAEKIKERLSLLIENAIVHNGTRVFLYGGDAGPEMWAAEIVLALRDKYPEVQLHVRIPFRYHDVDWDQCLQERFGIILAECDGEVYYEENGRGKNPFRLRRERNEKMVEEADGLIALWDWNLETLTAHTIAYARGLGRPVRTVSLASVA